MEPTQDYVRALFDYKDGALYWKIARSNNIKIGNKAGCFQHRKREIAKGYGPRIIINLDGKGHYASRIIFLWHKGYLPPIVDHENRNTIDDRIENLRAATYSQNNKNKNSAINSSSKYLGISWATTKNKWAVYITVNKKSIYGGRYFSEEQAALRYNQLAVFHHGEFASLNIINSL